MQQEKTRSQTGTENPVQLVPAGMIRTGVQEVEGEERYHTVTKPIPGAIV